MDENIDNDQTETVADTEDNSAYLISLSLIGFGVAVGVVGSKGYSKVKNVVKSQVHKYRLQKEIAELAEFNEDTKEK